MWRIPESDFRHFCHLSSVHVSLLVASGSNDPSKQSRRIFQYIYFHIYRDVSTEWMNYTFFQRWSQTSSNLSLRKDCVLLERYTLPHPLSGHIPLLSRLCFVEYSWHISTVYSGKRICGSFQTLSIVSICMISSPFSINILYSNIL